jgi:hypothetical protein
MIRRFHTWGNSGARHSEALGISSPGREAKPVSAIKEGMDGTLYRSRRVVEVDSDLYC